MQCAGFQIATLCHPVMVSFYWAFFILLEGTSAVGRPVAELGALAGCPNAVAGFNFFPQCAPRSS